MRYTQVIRGNLTDERGKLVGTQLFVDLDFETLTLGGHGIDGTIESEGHGDFASFESAYLRLARALFDDDRLQHARSIEGGPIADLGAFEAELRACGFDRPVVPLDESDPLEVMVAEFEWELRKELNRALGPEPGVVENVVFCTDDGRVHLAYVNVPSFCGEDEATIFEIQSRGWGEEDSEEHRRLRLPVSHEDWVQVPDDWREADLGYELRSTVLDLIDIRIEASPDLRPNITVREPLQVFHTIHENIWMDLDERRLARELCDQPASVYLGRMLERLTSKG